MTWHRRIKKALEKANLTNAQAAELIGISESAVSSLTRKSHKNTTKQFIKLAFLAVTIEENTFEFFFGKTEPFKLPEEQAQELKDEFDIPEEVIENTPDPIEQIVKKPSKRYINKNQISFCISEEEYGRMFFSDKPTEVLIKRNDRVIKVIPKSEYHRLEVIRKEKFKFLGSNEVYFVAIYRR